ncbi:MAG TPA: endonuclease/exonuclease/phosphatase family protein [Anaeromyxobacteraceae bacterium]|nr:endonuclease/exonuclease/phosphatase family protein [Anaeromyxobacteraceae bacterium]
MRARPSAVACLALAAALAACAESETPAKTQVAIGTRNLYLGTPIELALGDPPPGQTVYDVIDQLWAYVLATDFPARAGALADEITAHRPALVGLQEVSLWRTQICTPPCGDGPWNPATHVEYDFLQSLLEALQARGLTYAEVASVVNFDGEFTGASGNDYRYTDRDAIIALQGVPVANARGGNFDAALMVDVGGFPVTITRGWVSVDATVEGKTFRFASAHLDDSASEEGIRVQGEQALQFLDEVAGSLPLVAVGDFNSHPPPGEVRPAYGILTALATGLSDTWVELRPSETGASSFSCCRDGLLADTQSRHYERIDLILHGPEFSPLSVDITAGNGSVTISTSPPVWASDHAGMFGVLQID